LVFKSIGTHQMQTQIANEMAKRKLKKLKERELK